MKKILLFLLLSIQPVFAQSQYNCKSFDGTQALLTIESDTKGILWQDLSDSMDTVGVYIGIEDARYSPQRGYLIYEALSYEVPFGSAWYYKLDPNYKDQNNFKVIEVFDNDGHEEFETIFICE